jgi:hypothetical protein
MVLLICNTRCLRENSARAGMSEQLSIDAILTAYLPQQATQRVQSGASCMQFQEIIVRRPDFVYPLVTALSDPAKAIHSPRVDAYCFWGVPILVLAAVYVWLSIALALPAWWGQNAVAVLLLFSAVLTYAHLIAVVPRAYLNSKVFAENRLRLTVVPAVLMVVLLVSPAILILASIVGVFWDVHHSAMQNFGLSRIYDMKFGNGARVLRRTDLRLNWILYVGPLAAGGSLMTHIKIFGTMEKVGLTDLAALPGVLEQHLSVISMIAIAAWIGTVGWAIVDYRRAMKAGYKIPPHKAALLGSTGLVSVLAWGFSSPMIALISINIYHALQYFALIWLKEGDRITERTTVKPRMALDLFLVACALFGFAYRFAPNMKLAWLVAPFLACSLLHFWFDSFIWSVRKKQV